MKNCAKTRKIGAVHNWCSDYVESELTGNYKQFLVVFENKNFILEIDNIEHAIVHLKDKYPEEMKREYAILNIEENSYKWKVFHEEKSIQLVNEISSLLFD